MSEGITCYERDEELCEDPMCLRVGCRVRNEKLSPLKVDNMSEMVERVAQAMADGNWESLPEGVSTYGEDGLFRNDYRSLARAAIEAMREPTRKMLSAGGFYHIPGAGAVSESDMDIAKREWQAMIAEALK